MAKWTDIVSERKRLEKAYQESLVKLQSKCPHKHVMPSFFGGESVCLDCGKMRKARLCGLEPLHLGTI